MHKLGVESKITAAGFDILLARTEEWKFPDDVDFIEAFLDGHTDEAERKWTDRLTTGPIHFMVLEKPKAVEAWQELMGRCEDNDYQADGLDPDVSFKSIQKSLSQSAALPTAKLRQTYGVNLLYGSISREQAARQIAICAPELASEEAIDQLSMELSFLSNDDEGSEIGVDMEGPAPRAATSDSVDIAVGDDHKESNSEIVAEDELMRNDFGQVFDLKTGDEIEVKEQIMPEEHLKEEPRGNVEDRKLFKVQAVPAAVTRPPKVQPRLTKAAALRMGIKLPESPVRSPKPPALGVGSMGISGLLKEKVERPKSLAQPAVQPRSNRATLARLGGSAGDTTSSHRSAKSPPNVIKARKEVDFPGTPHHFKGSTVGGQGAVIASLAPPAIALRHNRVSEARTGVKERTPTTNGSCASENTAARSAVACPENGVSPVRERKPVDFANTPGHRRQSLAGSFNLASLKAPTIAPRSNRTAIARGGMSSANETGRSDGASASTRSMSPEKENRPKRQCPSAAATTSPVRQKPFAAADKTTAAPATLAGGEARPSSPIKAAGRERQPVDFSNTPGHKRTQSSFTVASLAAPKIVPRTNLAATRRLSIGGVGGAASRPASSLGGNDNAKASASRPASSLSKQNAGRTRDQARPASSAGIRSQTAKRNGAGPQGVVSPPVRSRAFPPSAFKAVVS